MTVVTGPRTASPDPTPPNATATALRGLRIGYVPYAPGCTAPGDRRRFPQYARKRGIRFEEVRPDRTYDLVYVTSHGDISRWRRTPRSGPRIAYEIIDSYLDEPLTPQSLLRGPGSYALGRYERLEWSFRHAMKKMCERADVVVCSTPEQRQRLLAHNRNVHAILDFHGDEVFATKRDYARRGPLRLVWDGLPGNLETFRTIARPLERLHAEHGIELHVLSKHRYRSVNGPVPTRSTRALLDRVLPGVPSFLHDWNEMAVSAIAVECDLAVIPMLLDSPMHRAKPENKLLFFWRLGLPVVTSATPAYVRAMTAAGVDGACVGEHEWSDRLHALAVDDEARRASAARGKRYVETEHAEDRGLVRWDEAFGTFLSVAPG